MRFIYFCAFCPWVRLGQKLGKTKTDNVIKYDKIYNG